tara:strand:+ start:158 stop:343 length:186 start_codon:yes stop_codon:yes gene_type:complete
MIRVEDQVWVNETTIGGKPLPHEWKGKVKSIENEVAVVEDVDDGDYTGECFTRMIWKLEPR